MITTRKIRTLTVYCGSGPGDNQEFVQEAHDLGEIFCQQDVGGVYGGGFVGLMGTFGSSMISHGGHITGVIPKLLIQKEQPIVAEHGNLAKHDRYQLIVTENMYERKRKFRELSDGFVVLPGGAGTLDEFFEEITGIQIGDHHKPMVIVNVKKFWDPLLYLLEHLRKHKFVREGLEFEQLFHVVTRVEDVLPNLRRMVGETNVVDLATQAKAAG